MEATTYDIKKGPHDGRKMFRKLGTCSRTFFYLINREFGHPKELEERAADALAGGIMQKGHQCGMLWGASLAVGAEVFRRYGDKDQAIAVAIAATQQIMASFEEREHTMNCREITKCDFSNRLSYAKYMVSGRFLHCFNLAQKWAPEAVQSAYTGLSSKENTEHKQCLSCSTEVARKMGATDEEMIMVAGFAGGLGLSGGACGALSAAIWLKSLAWCRENADESALKNPDSEETLSEFYKATDAKILCSEIAGTKFKDIGEHTAFVKRGGCNGVIKTLALS